MVSTLSKMRSTLGAFLSRISPLALSVLWSPSNVSEICSRFLLIPRYAACKARSFPRAEGRARRADAVDHRAVLQAPGDPACRDRWRERARPARRRWSRTSANRRRWRSGSASRSRRRREWRARARASSDRPSPRETRFSHLADLRRRRCESGLRTGARPGSRTGRRPCTCARSSRRPSRRRTQRAGRGPTRIRAPTLTSIARLKDLVAPSRRWALRLYR